MASSYWSSFLLLVDGARERIEESAEETRKRLSEANAQLSATMAPKVEELKAGTASAASASLTALGDLKDKSAVALTDAATKSSAALEASGAYITDVSSKGASYLGDLSGKSATVFNDAATKSSAAFQGLSESVTSSTSALYQATPSWEDVSKSSQMAKEKLTQSVPTIDLQQTAQTLKNAAASTQVAMKTTLDLVGSKVAPSMEELKIKTAVSTRNASTKAIESLTHFGDRLKADSDAQLEATLGITPFTERPPESFYRENYNAGIGLLSRNIHGLNVLGRNNRALAVRAERAEVGINDAAYAALQKEAECAQFAEAVKSVSNIRRDIDGIKSKLDNLLRRVVETEELLTKQEALVSAKELEEQKKVIHDELKLYEQQKEAEFVLMKVKVQQVKQRLFEEKNQRREEVMAPLKDEAREKLEVKVNKQLDEYAAYGFAVGAAQRKKRASHGPTLEEVSLEGEEKGPDDLDDFLSDAPETVDVGLAEDAEDSAKK